MTRIPRIETSLTAVASSLAAVAVLVTLVWWRPRSIMAVVLALLCVLLVMIAGVSVTDSRQRRAKAREQAGREPVEWSGQPVALPSGLDADTLEALDSRDALRMAQERRRAPGGVSDR
ncbi:hypothetical protein [Micromonospora okii]|uniref:hypothetical protein n=1 Tax=Micromonospora okii TaxID=1182970 RepID=UPI001E5F904C|nr:hypothetical protein [Micromonospora okii]